MSRVPYLVNRGLTVSDLQSGKQLSPRLQYKNGQHGGKQIIARQPSELTLLVGQQDGHLAFKNVCGLICWQ